LGVELRPALLAKADVMSLVEHRIESRRVPSTFVDVLSLGLKFTAISLPVKLGAPQHVIKRRERTDAIEINRHRSPRMRGVGASTGTGRSVRAFPVGGLPLRQRRVQSICSRGAAPRIRRVIVIETVRRRRTREATRATRSPAVRGFVQIR